MWGTNPTRRWVLASGGAAVLAGLAGCSGESDEPVEREPPTPTPEPSATRSPSPTPEPRALRAEGMEKDRSDQYLQARVINETDEWIPRALVSMSDGEEFRTGLWVYSIPPQGELPVYLVAEREATVGGTQTYAYIEETTFDGKFLPDLEEPLETTLRIEEVTSQEVVYSVPMVEGISGEDIIEVQYRRLGSESGNTFDTVTVRDGRLRLTRDYYGQTSPGLYPGVELGISTTTETQTLQVESPLPRYDVEITSLETERTSNELRLTSATVELTAQSAAAVKRGYVALFCTGQWASGRIPGLDTNEAVARNVFGLFNSGASEPANFLGATRVGDDELTVIPPATGADRVGASKSVEVRTDNPQTRINVPVEDADSISAAFVAEDTALAFDHQPVTPYLT